MCGGNGIVVYSCVSVSSFSLSISFFCALWCSIQVIVHVLYTPRCKYIHVRTLIIAKLASSIYIMGWYILSHARKMG